MSEFAEELIFVLVFAVVWLVQWLLKRWRSGTAARRAEGEPDTPDPAQPKHPPHPPPEVRVKPRAASTVSALPSPVAQRPSTAAATGAKRRFSRQVLLADRRALQDAIVIATILGPCRAPRPHDGD